MSRADKARANLFKMQNTLQPVVDLKLVDQGDQVNYSCVVDRDRPNAHFAEIFDYFVVRGYKVDDWKLATISRKESNMILKFRGTCPIHKRVHSSNNFYFFWRHTNSSPDYFSCFHGDEKANRQSVEIKIDLSHLK